MLRQRDVGAAAGPGCQRLLPLPTTALAAHLSPPSCREAAVGMERREKGEWQGSCAARSFPEAPRCPAVAGDCPGLPRGQSLPARAFSSAACSRAKLPSLPWQQAAVPLQHQLSSWHWSSRWEDLLAQLQEPVLTLGFLLFLLFKTTAHVSGAKLCCSYLPRSRTEQVCSCCGSGEVFKALLWGRGGGWKPVAFIIPFRAVS